MTITANDIAELIESSTRLPLKLEAGNPCDDLLNKCGIRAAMAAMPVHERMLGVDIEYSPWMPPNTLLMKNGEKSTLFMLGKDGSPKALDLELPPLMIRPLPPIQTEPDYSMSWIHRWAMPVVVPNMYVFASVATITPEQQARAKKLRARKMRYLRPPRARRSNRR